MSVMLSNVARRPLDEEIEPRDDASIASEDSFMDDESLLNFIMPDPHTKSSLEVHPKHAVAVSPSVLIVTVLLFSVSMVAFYLIHHHILGNPSQTSNTGVAVLEDLILHLHDALKNIQSSISDVSGTDIPMMKEALRYLQAQVIAAKQLAVLSAVINIITLVIVVFAVCRK